MPYHFQHPEHTGGELEIVGDNETEALRTLQDEYDLSLEEIVELTMDGFIKEVQS